MVARERELGAVGAPRHSGHCEAELLPRSAPEQSIIRTIRLDEPDLAAPHVRDGPCGCAGIRPPATAASVAGVVRLGWGVGVGACEGYREGENREERARPSEWRFSDFGVQSVRHGSSLRSLRWGSAERPIV